MDLPLQKNAAPPFKFLLISKTLLLCLYARGGNAPSSPQTAQVQLGEGMQEGRARLYVQVFGTKSDLLKA